MLINRLKLKIIIELLISLNLRLEMHIESFSVRVGEPFNLIYINKEIIMLKFHSQSFEYKFVFFSETKSLVAKYFEYKAQLSRKLESELYVAVLQSVFKLH